ncbi:MAG TPA: GTPase domain-containing protein [Thermodesulfovibrionales bacterium]|nr:GTPase domain-containing protein [Thermodesulfovibrionales bacterium]
MALFNYTTKEITVKVVYYGPGLSGKTTNLQYLHHIITPDRKGKLLCLPTESDRTLFFDLLPVDLGKIRDFSLRFQLYTVPGQVRYNATRKLVLKGADAVIFVADSQCEMREQNIESFKNMRDNLIANSINPDEIPIILQYNKRDLPNILSIDELNKDLNETDKYKYIESIAIDGTGVEDSFQDITKVVIDDIKHKVDLPYPDEVFKDIESEEIPVEVEIDESTPEEPVITSPVLEPTMYEPEAVENTAVEEIPVEVDIGESESILEEPVTTNPEIESTLYEPVEIERNKYIIPELKEEPTPAAIEKELALLKEVILKKAELPHSLEEKLDMLSKNITEILHTLKEFNRVIKDTMEEQRGINAQLRDIRKTLDSIKTKKKWFRFF